MMRMMIPRSEVVTDDAGWTWLQPLVSSTRVRHTTGTFFIALLILAGGATWTLLPQPSGAVATSAVVALGGWLLWGIVRGAGTKIAWSDLGLYVQDGGRAEQVGWTAVRGISAVPAGRRWRVRVDDGHRPRTTRASFEAAAARQWLASAADEAGRRRLDPTLLPDGAGFTAGAS